MAPRAPVRVGAHGDEETALLTAIANRDRDRPRRPAAARGPIARPHPSPGQTGAAAVELVLLALPLLLFILVAVGLGRIADSDFQVDGAAHAAARAGSIARSPAEAASSARGAAEAFLSAHGVSCRETSVDVDTSAFRAGGWVSADVRCTVELSDLVLAGFPGSRTLDHRFVSAVDTYRGTSP